MQLTFSEKIKNLTPRQYLVGVVILIALVVLGGTVFGNGNGDKEIVTVTRRDVVEEVVVSGRVEAGTVADLGFEISGRVQSVPVKEGDTVALGASLVLLDVGTLNAELAAARADVLVRQAELGNAQTNLNYVQEQQDTLVDSAYRTLLSSDLDAVASNDATTETPPIITGRYTGSEGRYKIRIKKQESNNAYDLYTFGIEDTGPVEIEKTTATRIGTHGLFASFPDGVAAYDDTIWYIDIPNKDASSYTENLNAYEEALRNREVALESAQAAVRAQQSGTSIAEAQLARAEAEVARLQAEIAKRQLRAPFAGTVTQVEVDPGEIVSANSAVVSLISDEGFGIEVDLPEIDSVKVHTGDLAEVTLDAFGESVIFDAMVTSVNRTETIVDGVPVYEASLAFVTADDERIRSGMTAEVTIQTQKKEDVLAIPIRVVRYKEDGTPYVQLNGGEGARDREVALGLRGSDSYVEVLAGLTEGEVIVANQ